MDRIRVVLIASADSSFVQTDRQILGEQFSVRYVPWNGKRSIPNLAWSILCSNVVFSWFALDHAYGACRIARALRRKSVVMVGGGDAAKRPDLDYGVYLDPIRGARSRYAVARSDRVLVVDDSLRDDLLRNARIQREDIVTVPLGFDTNRWLPDRGPRTTVLTVGVVDDINLRRKGLETFARTASLQPGIPFVIVGGRANPATERLLAIAPPNLQIVGRISDEELLAHFRRARVYVQISEYEAFGSALGEAMSTGCVPVGTKVGGIPTLIGDTGEYAPVRDPPATARAIRTGYDSGDGSRARDRIVRHFSLDRRRRALMKIIEEIVQS